MINVIAFDFKKPDPFIVKHIFSVVSRHKFGHYCSRFSHSIGRSDIMKKTIITAILLNFAFLIPASACTTLLVTKGASEDGSVIVAHSDDSELFDQRLVYVPAGGDLPGPL